MLAATESLSLLPLLRCNPPLFLVPVLVLVAARTCFCCFSTILSAGGILATASLLPLGSLSLLGLFFYSWLEKRVRDGGCRRALARGKGDRVYLLNAADGAEQGPVHPLPCVRQGPSPRTGHFALRFFRFEVGV